MMATPDYTNLALYRRWLAFTLQSFSQDLDAAKEYREALRLDPSWPKQCTIQAWQLATDPAPAERDPATVDALMYPPPSDFCDEAIVFRQFLILVPIKIASVSLSVHIGKLLHAVKVVRVLNGCGADVGH